MLRSIILVCAAGISAAALASATAQTVPAEASASVCPGERLSIYYARGASTPSNQAVELINRVGAEASRCKPDGIDLVTDIDTSGEGGDKQAIALALARLNSVAEVLIANGVPADRIRMAASPDADVMRPPMAEVGILFRNPSAAVSADDASTPKRKPTPLGQHPDVI